jgi:hypothetical protein
MKCPNCERETLSSGWCGDCRILVPEAPTPVAPPTPKPPRPPRKRATA